MNSSPIEQTNNTNNNKNINTINNLNSSTNFTKYFDIECKCCGHDPKNANCYCLCMCKPWCTKVCYLSRPFTNINSNVISSINNINTSDIPNNIKTSYISSNINQNDINIDILYQYIKLAENIYEQETKILNDFKNHIISIDEFHREYDKIRELKSKMP